MDPLAVYRDGSDERDRSAAGEAVGASWAAGARGVSAVVPRRLVIGDRAERRLSTGRAALRRPR